MPVEAEEEDTFPTTDAPLGAGKCLLIKTRMKTNEVEKKSQKPLASWTTTIRKDQTRSKTEAIRR